LLGGWRVDTEMRDNSSRARRTSGSWIYERRSDVKLTEMLDVKCRNRAAVDQVKAKTEDSRDSGTGDHGSGFKRLPSSFCGN
jgi:hypothetical protein